jgi:leucyl aminopeptidase
MKLKLVILILSFIFNQIGWAQDLYRFISIEKKIYQKIQPELTFTPKVSQENDYKIILHLTLAQIEEVSFHIHNKLKRCGGFMAHDDLNEAGIGINKVNKTINFFEYNIKKIPIVTPMLDLVSEEKIQNFILELSRFKTRHYNSNEGVSAVNLIKNKWQELTRHRNDVSIELINHPGWKQPSIILTINGKESPNDFIILGGHADSIAVDGDHAPGADDNASGMAVLTEIIRVLVSQSYQPKKSLQFMAYSAEEIGLLGSKEIAKSYRRDKKRVLGVMQYDMTLYNGNSEKEIYLTSDYTNRSQNTFLGNLIDEYIKVPWGYTACGYACSDHSSWTMMGFSASYPFESASENLNPKMHTKEDTIENPDYSMDLASNFVKLGIAYAIELDD